MFVRPVGVSYGGSNSPIRDSALAWMDAGPYFGPYFHGFPDNGGRAILRLLGCHVFIVNRDVNGDLELSFHGITSWNDLCLDG